MKINPKDSLDALVNAINHKYSELHNISNDDINNIEQKHSWFFSSV